MKITKTAVVFFLLVCVAYGQYDFKTAMAPPNGHDMSLGSINNRGLMTGLYYIGMDTNDFSKPRPVVIYPKGFVTVKIPNAKDVIAKYINNRNELTGWCTVASTLRGFVRFQNLSVRVFNVPGARITEPTCINDLGQRVGDFQDQNGIFHGFLSLGAGKFATIDFPASTGATGINNKGEIVGNYDIGDPPTSFHGFLLKEGTFQTIDFPGVTNTTVTGINNVGEIVGSYFDGHALHGFVQREGVFTTVDFAAAQLTNPGGINDLGQIVGRYLTDQDYGFIATPVTPVPQH